ncbi:hypothetical protein DH2020_015145 [Rehmannia glutinosa]|uniref:ELM2 domain-containing protein n=1 Tax=Rehmannia glutinosa TaxID=99300 RepID=A0ABR0WZ59_REHGL
MTTQQGRQGNGNVKAYLREGIKDAQKNSVFGSYSDTEMIARLKGLALDPCKPQFTKDYIEPVRNQILRIRKIMVLNDSNIPWKKRKLEQFVKDKLRAPSGFSVPEQRNGLDSVDSPKYHYKRTTSFMDDIIHWNSSNALSLEINNTIPYSSSPTLDGPSIRLWNIIANHLQRKAIPIGPRFQVDVPEWSSPVNTNILIDTYNRCPENSKWLGTRIWPIEKGNTETTQQTIGKGRPDSCCCVSPGSVDCIRHHVLEERLSLQRDLGPAFFSWRFDEMGHQVSKSWTLKERQTFESLVTMGPSRKKLLKHGLKCFSNKCRKDIIGYYFNVYIPQRMSLQVKSSPVNEIDTDDDEEEEDFSYLGMPKRSEGGRTLVSKFKEVKAQFLCRAS